MLLLLDVFLHGYEWKWKWEMNELKLRTCGVNVCVMVAGWLMEMKLAWHGIWHTNTFLCNLHLDLRFRGGIIIFWEISPGFVGFGVWRNVFFYFFSFLWILDFLDSDN
jgi:hypothetical protein